MTSRDVELLAVDVTARRIQGEHENAQAESTNNEQDALGVKRRKVLRAMCITSMVAVIISISAIVIGALALVSYVSEFGYIIGGSVVSGGLALLLAIFTLCMYHEGKKTKRGNKMGALYMCCLYSMIIGFAFGMCGILMVLGISGIWGTVECVRAKQRMYINTNNCLENTDARLAISLLTLGTACVLLFLTTSIMCIFSCNKKALGYKTVYQKQAEFYDDIRREARDEALREVAARNHHRYIQSRQTSANRRPEEGKYGKRCLAGPSAPPLEEEHIEEPPPSYNEVINIGVK